jgi:large conductance mechanosensitive channel
MLKEFRDFIFRGSALDLAIGVVLGVAFGALVTAITEGLLMALVAAIFGKPDFNALAFSINGAVFQYGRVLTALINLVLIGLVLYGIIKAINKVRGETRIVPETDHDLLAQIRDELRAHPQARDLGPQVAPLGTH